jgi:hypothetical protein
MLAGDDPSLNTTNTESNLEMEKDVEEWILQKMAKVHNVLVLGQGSQSLCAMQK